jgi:hypothetical protein
MKVEAIVTKRRINGNRDKNMLKENAPAHCTPSIRRNFLKARKRIFQTRAILRSKMLVLLKGDTN